MNIEFGVSTWLWTSPFTTETVRLFPKIKKMGYDFVEIPVEDPALIDAGAVKNALEENELKATVCGAFGPSRDLTNEDENVHKTCFSYIESCLDLCTAWNVKFFAGPMYSAVGKARLVSAEQKANEWNLAVENLRKVCGMAQDRGLEIALEPLNRFESDLINTAEDAVRLVTDIDHPAAKICLDGFHMNIEEKDAATAIKQADGKLIHLQVSENYRGTPGTGSTNWQAYKEALDDVDYQGGIAIESFTPEVKELASAVCIWKPLVPSQDGFASEGADFLKKVFQ
jgi:D-psicose/D-tagatose/L-ribulose 3-epimerase